MTTSLVNEIEQPKNVFVEGNDEVFLIQALLDHTSISDIQIQNMERIGNLRRFLRIFRTRPGFDSVRSLAVVADADLDRSSRERRIQGALRDAGFPAPTGPLAMASDAQLSVAYLVVPHGSQGTMIEDVCLESVSADPAMECVDRYFDCVSQAGVPGPRPHWSSKARAHAFLASRERPDLRLGEAAQSGVWNFESDAFSPLKNLLGML